jgi:putative transposase
MPRKPRIQKADGVYHVTVRGTEGRPIFIDDRDRRYLLRLVAEVVEELSWRVYAYCQMTNHFHLAFQTPTPDLAHGMHHINGLYANRFNRRHAHVGHLQQSRYGATLVESEAHLLLVCRYVVLNPVRAAMCARPAGHRWSSYRATAHLEHAPDWLDVPAVLSWFDGTTTPARVARYVDFVASAIEPEPSRRDVFRGLAPEHVPSRPLEVRAPART